MEHHPNNGSLRYEAIASDNRLRKGVTWVGVIGTALLSFYFFGFLVYQTICGASEPRNWLTMIAKTHYAALVGTPMSAAAAFSIVSILKVTNGPIEFEALGFKFHGASGPIIMWALCFLFIVFAFHLLWTSVA